MQQTAIKDSNSIGLFVPAHLSIQLPDSGWKKAHTAGSGVSEHACVRLSASVDRPIPEVECAHLGG